MNLKRYVPIILCLVFVNQSYSTTTKKRIRRVPPQEQPKKNITFPLNSNGSQYVQLTFLNQTWVRYTENNPGTLIDGRPHSEVFDIGLRRTRLQLFGQIGKRTFFYTQFGQNNLTYRSPRKQGLFFHDALGEFQLIKKHLSIGAGLTGWSGLSRYASPSIGSILTLDAPLYQQATNDITDQFIRKYSIYAKGKLSKLDYRIALSTPMSVWQSSVSIPSISSTATFSNRPAKPQTQAYFMYQFLDQESNKTPYNTGSYLGQKRIFNVGLGTIYQPDAMWWLEDGNTITSALRLIALDVFYDAPVNRVNHTALTLYACYNLNDFGPNYIRNVGVMNPSASAIPGRSLNGPGNAFPMIGTGNTTYIQMGYLLKTGLFGELGTLQPFAATQTSQFEAINKRSTMYELGVNWLMDSHNSKLSVEYQSRPVYKGRSNGKWDQIERKGMWVMQYQVAI